MLPIERKNKFWKYLDEDVELANKSNSGFVLQFDGNLWAGPKIVPGDPRPQNRNGKLFEDFLARNPHLTIVNSLSICQGLITRSRIKDGIVIDFFVVCSKVLPYVTRMVIDESKKFVLTNYKNAAKTGKGVDSDHLIY